MKYELTTNCQYANSSLLQLIQRVCQLLICTSVILFSCSCSKRYDDMPAYLPIPMGDYSNEGVGRFKTAYIVDQIDQHFRGTNPGPIGVTTFVNVDDLYNTSTFGRMYSEQLMSELAMRGFDVIELRHADALQFMSGRGEFALSRDMGSIRRSRELGGVVVGTYVVSPVRVYVNARMIDPSTSIVLSAGSVEMSKTTELARMLRGGAFPGTLERIPVRHVGISTVPLTINASDSGRVYDLEESANWPIPNSPNSRATQKSEPSFLPETKTVSPQIESSDNFKVTDGGAS